MKQIPRFLDFDLPPGQSAFLWGARKVGKTTFLKARFPQSLRFDFLQTELHMEILTRPHVLREQLIAERDRNRRPAGDSR